MSRRRSLLLQLFAVLLLFLGVFSVLTYRQASADIWGAQAHYHGYFSDLDTGDPYCSQFPGQCTGGDTNDVLPPYTCGGDNEALPNPSGCIDNVHNLISRLRNYNVNGSHASRERSSSAFIYWSLLGKQRGFANNNGGRDPTGYAIPGVTSATGDTGWAALEDLINDEIADGQISIRWNVSSSEFPRTYSMFIPSQNQADVAYDDGNGSQTGNSIVFYDGNGNRIYTLFRACANPGGTLIGLPPLKGWTLSLSSSVDTAIAQPGDTVTFTHTIHNNGPTDASFNHRVESAFPTTAGYTNGTYFAKNNMAANSTITVVRGFTAPATAGLYCERIHVDDYDDKGDGKTSAPACVRVVVLSCGTVSTTPSPLQPGDTLTNIKVAMHFVGGLPPYTGITMRVAAPYNGGGYTATATGGNLTRSGTTLTGTFTGLPGTPATGANNYTLTYDLMDGGTVVYGSCPGGFGTRNLPYFSVFGSSVSAGGDFDDNGSGCANGAGNGTISSYYDSQTAFAGANTFLAAVALGQITGFASAQFQTGGATGNRPIGLTFADTGGGAVTTSPTLPQLGGDYAGAGGGTSCLFTPKLPSGTATVAAPATPVNVSALSAAAHSYTGNVTLTGGTGIPAANNVSVFVKGNVYINSNIFYANPNGAGNWSVTVGGTNNVPSFTLKVTGGNIYVADNVTELDGMYVAEAASGTGGTIYTCGTAYAPDAAANLYNCNNQLIIYGSFVADQVNLMRTYGTLRNAATGDWPGGGSKQCSGGPNAPVCASEIFEFSPELYLSSPAIQQPSNSPPTYNSISSLPPVL